MTKRSVLGAGICLLLGLACIAPFGNLEPMRARGAQQSTPSAGVCTVAPRSLADLRATPVAPLVPAEVQLKLPTGAPVEPAVAQQVISVVRQLELCASSGEVLRFLALFTNDALVQLGMSADEAALDEFSEVASAPATPYPPGEGAVFVGPWHMRLLPDGRVMAAVTWFESEADTCINPSRIRVLLFAERDGQWLVDEIVKQVAAGELIDLVGPPPADSAFTQRAVCAGEG